MRSARAAHVQCVWYARAAHACACACVSHERCRRSTGAVQARRMGSVRKINTCVQRMSSAWAGRKQCIHAQGSAGAVCTTDVRAAHRHRRSVVRARTWNSPAVRARPVRAMHRNLRCVSCGAYRQRTPDVHEPLALSTISARRSWWSAVSIARASDAVAPRQQAHGCSAPAIGPRGPHARRGLSTKPTCSEVAVTKAVVTSRYRCCRCGKL